MPVHNSALTGQTKIQYRLASKGNKMLSISSRCLQHVDCIMTMDCYGLASPYVLPKQRCSQLKQQHQSTDASQFITTHSQCTAISRTKHVSCVGCGSVDAERTH